MTPTTLRIIRDEHATLNAMLQSMELMIKRGPLDTPEQFFDVLRAMLFYIDEFPERLHHPKETELLFPRVAQHAPEIGATLDKLLADHAISEAAVRELQHLLLAWELVGESRRQKFEAAARGYIAQYLAHMQLEESVVLPAAERVLNAEDWHALDVAFANNQDPLGGSQARDPVYDRLFTRIVMRAPAPIGVG
jgi:hemerythrin-like domain-containing protein